MAQNTRAGAEEERTWRRRKTGGATLKHSMGKTGSTRPGLRGRVHCAHCDRSTHGGFMFLSTGDLCSLLGGTGADLYCYRSPGNNTEPTGLMLPSINPIYHGHEPIPGSSMLKKTQRVSQSIPIRRHIPTPHRKPSALTRSMKLSGT